MYRNVDWRNSSKGLKIEWLLGRQKTRRFHSGDLFVVGKTTRAQSRRNGSNRGAPWDPQGKLVYGSGKTELGIEKPKSEWNEMEIRVYGHKKAIFILNGEVVYEVLNMEEKNGNKYVPLKKGHIGLQAEWAEILYRNIRIKELPKNTKEQ